SPFLGEREEGGEFRPRLPCAVPFERGFLLPSTQRGSHCAENGHQGEYELARQSEPDDSSYRHGEGQNNFHVQTSNRLHAFRGNKENLNPRILEFLTFLPVIDSVGTKKKLKT